MNIENLILLRKELTRDEGVRYEAYQDTVGLWTIGYGHLLGTDQRMTYITFSEAEALLDSDIKHAEQLVRNMVMGLRTGSVGASRQRALVNMAFNLGPRLGQFKKFITAVNAGDWPTAAVEMMDSKWAKQVGDRAARLRDMILTDD